MTRTVWPLRSLSIHRLGRNSGHWRQLFFRPGASRYEPPEQPDQTNRSSHQHTGRNLRPREWLTEYGRDRLRRRLRFAQTVEAVRQRFGMERADDEKGQLCLSLGFGLAFFLERRNPDNRPTQTILYAFAGTHRFVS